MSDQKNLSTKNTAERELLSALRAILSPPPGLNKFRSQGPEATVMHVENSDNADSAQSAYDRTGIQPFPPPREAKEENDHSSPYEWDTLPELSDSDSTSSNTLSFGGPPSPNFKPPIVPRLDCLTDLNWEDMWNFLEQTNGTGHVKLSTSHYNGILQVLTHHLRQLPHWSVTSPALLCLDWVADNPSDPEYRGPKLSAEGRRNDRHKTYLLQQAQQRIGQPATILPIPDSHWNRILPYGHWIKGDDGSDVFLEIQVKRISGRRIDLLHSVGVHHQYAFLGIRSTNYANPAARPPSSTADEDSFYPNTLKRYIHPLFRSDWMSGSLRRENEAAEGKLKSRMHEDPMFHERVMESFIYLVRVVAMPRSADKSRYLNGLMGPARPDRMASLCAMGGWVAPYTTSRRRMHPQAQRNIAEPIRPDWTCQSPVALEGDYLPIWDSSSEPTLSHVLEMVSQLMAGKRFIGLRIGSGFGRDRKEHWERMQSVADQNLSPSLGA